MRQASLETLVAELGAETGRPTNVAFGAMRLAPVSEVLPDLAALVGAPTSVAFGAMPTATLDDLIRELSYEIGKPTNVAFGQMRVAAVGDVIGHARHEAGQQDAPSLGQSQTDALIEVANRTQRSLLAQFQFPGNPVHVEMVRMGDPCVLDRDILALSMAGELLARQKAEDAAVKFQRANDLTQAWVQAEQMRQLLNRGQRTLFAQFEWPGLTVRPPEMVLAADTCQIDKDALVLFAAAATLARSASPDAEAKAQQAQSHIRVWTQQAAMLDALNRTQRTLAAEHDFPLLAGPGAVTPLVDGASVTSLDADTLVVATAEDYLGRTTGAVPEIVVERSRKLIRIWTQQEEFRQVLNRVQRYLDQHYDWPDQLATRIVAAPAGARFLEFPADLPSLRVAKVHVRYLDAYIPVTFGFDSAAFTGYSSPDGETRDPIRHWREVQSVTDAAGAELLTGPGRTKIEVWPVPATDQELTFEGRRLIADMVLPGDLCVIDADVLVLKAASEILERAGAADAPIKARRAEKHLRALRFRGGNEQSSARYLGQVGTGARRPRPGIDFIKD